MKIAQILYGKLHYIFESDEMPNWPPDQDGNAIVLVDITGKDAKEQDGWNPDTKKVIPYPTPEPQEGMVPAVTWNEMTYEFDIAYVDLPPEPEPVFSTDEFLRGIVEGYYAR